MARILIVDDSPVIRTLIGAALRSGLKFPFDLHEAPNGRIGLQAMGTRQMSLVITDFHMDQMDGLEFARSIRAAKSEATRTTPVLLLSSDKSPDLAARCRAAGVDAILPKPCRTPDLVETARALIRSRHSSGPPSGAGWVRE